jgi:protein tyrosine phosphatase
MSRVKAREHSFKENINKCIIVSINDTFVDANEFNNNPNIKGVCSLFFNDVEGNGIGHMVREDADRIIEFVNRHVNNVDEIIVHCGAGVSRSAGVCAALMLILNGNDSAIFNNGKFCPNMHCYRLVLESYFGRYDKKAADENIRRNIIEWRKLNELD